MDTIMSEVRAGKQDVDVLIDQLMNDLPTENTPDGTSHVSWLKREVVKLLRAQLDLASKEAKLDSRERSIAAREREIRKNHM